MNTVHFLVPAGVADPARPSGGNVFDQRIAAALPEHGWTAQEHLIPGSWPHPAAADRARMAELLSLLPDGAVVLMDGLIGSAAPEVILRQSFRLRLVMLSHSPVTDGAEYERVAMRGVAAVITPSQAAGSLLRERFGVQAAALHVALPGVDRGAPAAPSDDGGRLLSVGVLAPHKGQDRLVEALHELAPVPWRCHLVGAVDQDPAFTNRLRRRIAATRLEGRVTLAGPLSGPDLDAAYTAADLLVVASRSETYGMVITEALAHGVPVVAPDLGGAPEALGRTSHGRPGLLTRPGDVRDLTRALRRWFDDPNLRTLLRRAAAERRGTLTDWSVTARQVAAVLTAVAA